jgi:hypothetical protein
VVTSTGYAEENGSNLAKYRVPTGTFYINRTANLLNIYLGAVYGQGRYVEQTFGNQIYLNHKLIEQKRAAMSEVLGRCQAFLIQNEGVADVYTSDRLLAGNYDIAKIRNGFNPSVSGDIIIEVAPAGNCSTRIPKKPIPVARDLCLFLSSSWVKTSLPVASPLRLLSTKLLQQ